MSEIKLIDPSSATMLEVDTEGTRNALGAWMAAMGSGDADRIAALAAPEARVIWQKTAAVPPYVGPREIAEALATGLPQRTLGLDLSTFAATPGRVVVDGHVAVVEMQVTARSTSGSPYDNDYIFVYEFNDDGLLVEMREYGDTLHAARQLPEAFGATQ